METTNPIDVDAVIESLGGSSKVADDCEITVSAVSQWRSSGHIPKPWLKYLREKYPEKFGIDRRLGNRRRSNGRRSSNGHTKVV